MEFRLPKLFSEYTTVARETELIHVFKSSFFFPVPGTKLVNVRQAGALLLSWIQRLLFIFGDEISLSCPN